MAYVTTLYSQVPQGHYEYGTSVQRQTFEVHVDSEEPSSQMLHSQQHVVMDKVLSARKPEKPHSVMETLQRVCISSIQYIYKGS